MTTVTASGRGACPRTLAQAESLKELMEKEKLSLSAVVNYELPVDEIIRRLSGRRTCEPCKSVFHVTERPPKVDRCAITAAVGSFTAKMTGPRPSPCVWTLTNEAPRHSS